MTANHLTAEFVRSILRYEPETGLFFWLVARKKDQVGAVAGNQGNPYRQIKIRGENYLPGRLAWLCIKGEWPKHEIDHKDGDPSNNRWTNLREASRQQNAANRGKHKNNKSGFKGVSWSSRSSRWYATIQVSGRSLSLGFYKTPEEASAVYQRAAEVYFGEFSRG